MATALSALRDKRSLFNVYGAEYALNRVINNVDLASVGIAWRFRRRSEKIPEHTG
jgi:hypothetical protein